MVEYHDSVITKVLIHFLFTKGMVACGRDDFVLFANLFFVALPAWQAGRVHLEQRLRLCEAHRQAFLSSPELRSTVHEA